jgi:hypothetical protein
VTEATSGKQDNTRQDHQEHCRAGDRKINSRDFHYTGKNKRQDIVEGLTPSETKEQTAHRVRAGDIGTVAILGSFAPTDQKSRMTG